MEVDAGHLGHVGFVDQEVALGLDVAQRVLGEPLELARPCWPWQPGSGPRALGVGLALADGDLRPHRRRPLPSRMVTRLPSSMAITSAPAASISGMPASVRASGPMFGYRPVWTTTR